MKNKKLNKRVTVKAHCLIPCLIVLSLFPGCQTVSSLGSGSSAKEEILDNELAVVSSHLDAAQPDKALRELQELQKQYGDHPKVLNSFGLTQLALRNNERAVDFLRKSYALRPSISTGLNLSAALIESNKFKEAEKLLKTLWKKRSEEAYSYPERIMHNLALVYEKQQRWNMAEQFYKKSLEDNPTFYLARLNLGRLYKKTKRPGLAKQAFEDARQGCPACYEPLEEVVRFYAQKGMKSDAQKLIGLYAKTEGVTPQDLDRARSLSRQLKL